MLQISAQQSCFKYGSKYCFKYKSQKFVWHKLAAVWQHHNTSLLCKIDNSLFKIHSIYAETFIFLIFILFVFTYLFECLAYAYTLFTFSYRSCIIILLYFLSAESFYYLVKKKFVILHLCFLWTILRYQQCPKAFVNWRYQNNF